MICADCAVSTFGPHRVVPYVGSGAAAIVPTHSGTSAWWSQARMVMFPRIVGTVAPPSLADTWPASKLPVCLTAHAHACIDSNGVQRPASRLDLADLDVLLTSKALFARKFQGPRSAPLLSRLEDP